MPNIELRQILTTFQVLTWLTLLLLTKQLIVINFSVNKMTNNSNKTAQCTNYFHYQIINQSYQDDQFNLFNPTENLTDSTHHHDQSEKANQLINIFCSLHYQLSTAYDYFKLNFCDQLSTDEQTNGELLIHLCVQLVNNQTTIKFYIVTANCAKYIRFNYNLNQLANQSYLQICYINRNSTEISPNSLDSLAIKNTNSIELSTNSPLNRFRRQFADFRSVSDPDELSSPSELDTHPNSDESDVVENATTSSTESNQDISTTMAKPPIRPHGLIVLMMIFVPAISIVAGVGLCYVTRRKTFEEQAIYEAKLRTMDDSKSKSGKGSISTESMKMRSTDLMARSSPALSSSSDTINSSRPLPGRPP